MFVGAPRPAGVARPGPAVMRWFAISQHAAAVVRSIAISQRAAAVMRWFAISQHAAAVMRSIAISQRAAAVVTVAVPGRPGRPFASF